MSSICDVYIFSSTYLCLSQLPVQGLDLFLVAASPSGLTARSSGGGHGLLVSILGGAPCVQLVLAESIILCPHPLELLLGVRDPLPQLVH